jgi:hypothetical protein
MPSLGEEHRMALTAELRQASAPEHSIYTSEGFAARMKRAEPLTETLFLEACSQIVRSLVNLYEPPVRAARIVRQGLDVLLARGIAVSMYLPLRKRGSGITKILEAENYTSQIPSYSHAAVLFP